MRERGLGGWRASAGWAGKGFRGMDEEVRLWDGRKLYSRSIRVGLDQMWQTGQVKRNKDELGRFDHCTHLSLPLPPQLSHASLSEANRTSWIRTCTSLKLPHAPPNLGTSPHNASRSPPLLRTLDYTPTAFPPFHSNSSHSSTKSPHANTLCKARAFPPIHAHQTPPRHTTPPRPQPPQKDGPLHPLHACPRRLLARNRHHARQSLCAEVQGQAVECPARGFVVCVWECAAA